MSETLFGIRAGKRVEIIIDGVHLYNLCRNLGFDIDYERLRTLLFDVYDCRRINYIMKVAFNQEGEIQQPAIAKMLDFLRYNGHKTIIGELKEWTSADGRRVVRHNVDVIIACAMLEAAARGIDEIILFAGSEDLVPAILSSQSLGARVTLVSSMKPQPMVSNDLRTEADWFVDIADARIRQALIRREREPREREPRDNSGTDTTPLNLGPAAGAVVVEDRRDQTLAARARIHSRKN